jgi:glycosyltransferase involved in cell wall biosynthesis
MQSKRLIFISRYDLSSAPYAELPLPALAKDGWKITVVSVGAESSVLRKVIPYPCTVRNLTRQSGSSIFEQEAELFRELFSARWGSDDVIFIHSQSLSIRASLALAGTSWRKPIVYHAPDYYDPLKFPLSCQLEGWFCRQIKCHINHEFHRGYIYRERYRMTCPIVISPPNLPAAWPIPPTSEAKRNQFSGGQEDGFVLMLHGGFSSLRMVLQLFEALSLLPDQFRLVMTGRTPDRDEVDDMLEKFDIAHRTLRLPRLEFTELFKYTVNADVGVLLYQNNDLGNFFQAPGRLTEYLACGLPLLATNHTGLENLVRRFDLGACVDSTQPERIAEAIKELESAKKSGQYSREKIRNCFVRHFAFEHWEPRVCQAFNQLFDGSCDKPSPPPSLWFPNG